MLSVFLSFSSIQTADSNADTREHLCSCLLLFILYHSTLSIVSFFWFLLFISFLFARHFQLLFTSICVRVLFYFIICSIAWTKLISIFNDKPHLLYNTSVMVNHEEVFVGKIIVNRWMWVVKLLNWFNSHTEKRSIGCIIIYQAYCIEQNWKEINENIFSNKNYLLHDQCGAKKLFNIKRIRFCNEKKNP